LVIVPLMPEGVEHIDCRFIFGGARVIVPLMPEGVEHRSLKALRSIRQRVIVPLMPEGVEHPSAIDSSLFSSL